MMEQLSWDLRPAGSKITSMPPTMNALHLVKKMIHVTDPIYESIKSTFQIRIQFNRVFFIYLAI